METRPTVAVAESCTGGLLSAALVATPGSGDWFLGGVVAYDSTVKHRLLGVPRGPVITAEAAESMAKGVRALLGADIGVATTGVAGPDTEEGQPVGTVFIGVCHPERSLTVSLQIDGDPDEVKAATVDRALWELGVRELGPGDRSWFHHPSSVPGEATRPR
jgi:PncC family amidohydrolase